MPLKEKKLRLIRQAKGAEPADLVLKNCRIINVFTRELVKADVAICDEWIAGVGKYNGVREIDCCKYFVSPGFIEGHIHIESSMLNPEEFVYAVLPFGTTTVVCDPHEIANVAGLAGINYILEETKDLPVTVFVMAPSCVPATHFETSGAVLDLESITDLFKHPRVIGLAEMMNYPGVLAGDGMIIDKISYTRNRKLPVDGHSPGVSGKDLQAYISVGIGSDHECTTREEALEKLRSGMYLFIREGTVAKNLVELLSVVTEKNMHRCLFVTDDCHPYELQRKGHLDHILRKAIGLGLDPLMAIQMVTINVAGYFQLSDRGAIGPGYRADMVLFENLQELKPCHVFSGGRLTVEHGNIIEKRQQKRKREYQEVFHSVRVQWEKISFKVPAGKGKMRVIGVIKDQILTEAVEIEATVKDGQAIADPGRDLAKIAVIERHHGTGRMGVGFVMGFGIKYGALASTVAHDSHNIIVVGMSDEDMEMAARSVALAGGGSAVVADNRVLSLLQLDVAGLMSPCSLKEVNDQLDDLLAATRRLGGGDNAFMLMSFLALPVIPHLKITDWGLIDVDIFKPVGLWL